MDLSIIIVSWNVKSKLKENLTALYRSAGEIKFEVFVVDNNSSDGSAEMVSDKFKEVKLIANRENLGFAKANNQALRLRSRQARYVLLLNPDMRVLPDTLANMIKWMDGQPRAAVAGCHLTDEFGNTVKHVRRFPAVTDQLAVVLKLPHILPGILNKYLCADFDYSRAAAVDSIRGSFFMIRAGAMAEPPLLDERYFIWFEEVDFCKQVRQAGGQVWYTPAAKCVDCVGQSFKQVKSNVKQNYFRDSMIKYFKKWHPIWQSLLLELAWAPLSLFYAIQKSRNNHS